jgi:hypothetical protein
MQPLISALPIFIIKSQYGYRSIFMDYQQYTKTSVYYCFSIPVSDYSGQQTFSPPRVSQESRILVFAQAQLFTYIEILVLLYGNSTQLFAVKYALFSAPPLTISIESAVHNIVHALMN